MVWVFRSLRIILFLSFYSLEITVAKAADSVFFVAKPENCIQKQTSPCALSSGDRPYSFYWQENKWELAKNTVIRQGVAAGWKIANGEFIVQSTGAEQIETPFGEIHLGKATIYVEVLENKMQIFVLKGESVKIQLRAIEEPQWLVEGFGNWYGGVGPEGQEMGIPLIIDIDVYAKKRVQFFSDHKVGFISEIKRLSKVIHRASVQSAMIHKNLVYQKIAMLQNRHDEKVAEKKRQVRHNFYLRELFRKKINYDD